MLYVAYKFMGDQFIYGVIDSNKSELQYRILKKGKDDKEIYTFQGYFKQDTSYFVYSKNVESTLGEIISSTENVYLSSFQVHPSIL